MKSIIYIPTFLLSIVLLSIIKNYIISILGGIIIAILLLLIDELLANSKWLSTFFQSFIYYNKLIRVSISYLYCIKIDDKYLLIKGGRITNLYQPNGGVYKRYESSNRFFNKKNALDDDRVPFDDISRNDLRIFIKGKHLPSLILWFNRNEDREIIPTREFYEELIKAGHYKHNDFPYLDLQFIKREFSKIKYSDLFII